MHEAEPLAPRRRRRPSAVVVWSLVAALLMAAGVAGGWYLTSGRYTEVPSALRLDRATATEQLEAAGFSVEVDPQPRFSENVAPGLVMGQAPESGERVRKGSAITLLISRGPDRRAVPEVIGMPQADAVAALEKAGLAVGGVTEAFSTSAAGAVISASPDPGTAHPPGTKVALVVSKGPEMLAVPDVRGSSRGDAEKALAEAGFGAEVTEVFSEKVKKGVVVAQEPASGRAPRDSTVALQVSKGPELITIPDVVGERRRDAEARLTSLGLKVQVRAIPGPGTVRSTNPGAGERVRKGSTVTLFVF